MLRLSSSPSQVRRADDGALTIPPALGDRPWTVFPGSRLRPRNASSSPMGRDVSMGGLGCGRGPLVRPALSQTHHAGPSAGLDPGLVGIGVIEARVDLF